MVASDLDLPPPDGTAAETVSVPAAASNARITGLAWFAGALAGGGAWLSGEGILGAYHSALNPKIGREIDAEAVRRFVGAHLDSASWTYAALGGVLGLALGLAGGLARRSASAGVKAAVLGCVLGVIAGFSTSRLVLPHFLKTHDPQSQDLLMPLLTVGAIATAVGAAAGLAFGIGLGGRERWGKALVGGLIGAALGTAAYELVGAMAFPTAKTELPISHEMLTRAMLHIFVAVLASAGAALVLGLSPRKPAGTPPKP